MMPGAAVRAVSWDLDGTLYSLARFKTELRRLARRRLLGGHWSETYRAWRTLRKQRQSVAALRERGGQLTPQGPPWAGPAYERLLKEWFLPALEATGPRPGVRLALQAVRESGRRQVLLSDFRADAKLKSLGLDGYFEQLFAGEDLGALKPAPELFRHVGEALHLPPAEILHIGDRSDCDRVGAEAAGCQVFILGEDLPSFPELARLLTETPL